MNNTKTTNIKAKVFVALPIFGTTGFFLRYIKMPIATATLICTLIGILTVMVVMRTTNRKIRWRYIKKSLPLTLLSGVALGGSWILLFLARENSDSAIATVYYYFAPLALTFVAPLLGEKFREQKLWLCAVCLAGLVLTSNGFVWDVKFLLALGAGVLQCVVIVCNKKLSNISSYDKTVLQLVVSAIVLLPYCLLTNGLAVTEIGATELAALVILGVGYVGILCRIYFEGVACLPLQTIAVYSYIIPAVTIFISGFVMNHKLSLGEVVGVALILGGIMIGELNKENLGRLFDKKG